jgi:hypothetical protein
MMEVWVFFWSLQDVISPMLFRRTGAGFGRAKKTAAPDQARLLIETEERQAPGQGTS